MNCKYCKADCVHRGEHREKECKGYIPMTNADRIRAMSDEELAEIIRCPYATYPDICRTPGTCLDCCEIWLRQPADTKEG